MGCKKSQRSKDLTQKNFRATELFTRVFNCLLSYSLMSKFEPAFDN